jgi:type II secretory pathway component PulC
MSDNKLMVNKFKDFLEKLRGKFRRSSPRADQTGEIDVSNEELETDEESSSPRIKLQKINRFSPYFHRINEAIAPLGNKIKIALSSILNRSGVGQKLQQTDWGALVDRLLSRDSFNSHHRVFLIAFLFITTYSIGKITALILRGRPTFAPIANVQEIRVDESFRISDLNQVKASDPFRTKDGQGQKKQLADTNCDKAESRSSLPLKLVNTVVLQDSVKSIAAVQVRSGRDLKQFREGDTVDGMAKIFKIDRLELVIKNLQTGECELVASDKSRELRKNITVMTAASGEEFKKQQKIKGIENQGNKYVIAKDLLDDKLKDIQGVLTEARAIKIQQPDGTLAFKITEIEAGGIFSYLGIQNEDIITSINGKPISDLNEVMALFGRIKNLDQLQLGVRRDGEETQMEYVMKK